LENPTVLRTFENTPILGVEASLSNFPCIDEKRKCLSFSGMSYPGLMKGWEGCGNYGNIKQWSNKLEETTTQASFYSENQIHVEELPFWDYFQRFEDKFNIYSIHRIKFSDDNKCKGLSEKIDKLSKYSDEILIAALWIAKISIFICLIGIFFGLGKEINF
jgi:hypothetical protein